ncbi:hypothetical protein, partial [Paraglaciecola hydrolytica]|uniref:hypothetical protein n=1 Tax=Paraglaciecola hydrolytica TaxID=1799789 RepID=UPI00138F2648
MGHIEPLPYNINISSDDITGHSLIKTYLKEGASHTNNTISRILTYFDEMQPEQTNSSCQDSTNNYYSGNSYRNYNPSTSTSGYNGILNIYIDALSEPDSFQILDKNNKVIFSTSLIAYVHRFTLAYNYNIHGTLKILVTAANFSAG